MGVGKGVGQSKHLPPHPDILKTQTEREGSIPNINTKNGKLSLFFYSEYCKVIIRNSPKLT
jgi:hypothetical protein